ncbi:MAG: NACHT domain-containing protein [Rhizonema sp. PD38]|nr:NACHT domain-containing protein [Rhizonema sp. PD38]
MTKTVATQLKAISFERDIERLTESFTGREWIFEEIDRWLQQDNERFFILTGEPGVGKSAIAAQITQTRKDIAAYHFCITRQISTVEPNNVLLSLAAQLVKYFPDYGEALINTVKPLFLKVNVEINIKNIRDSVVQGVVIENLHIHYPNEALDIVLRRALGALPNPPKEPVSILIDSLDEAVTYSNENNLVTLLSNVDDLPSWVRFILTSRPDKQRVLSYFETLKPYYYHLNELSEKNKKDIHQYVDGRVLSEPIQVQIQRFQVQSKALINQITELSKGNFLYTKVLLDDIELGGQPIDNLAALPKSLNGLYHNFLLRLKGEWEGKYQHIFGILTVTKAPVTEKELANLLSEQLKETELGQRLRVVEQFLDVVQNDYAENTYTLFHQSLQDYLIDKEKSGVFHCSPKDGHRQIIEYCWQYHPRDWRECDRYGLRYLAIHLLDIAALEKPPIKARKYIERLHELLATEVDGRNAWFDAKDRIRETAGFLADVNLAWSQAEEAYDREPAKSIGLQCRYALMTSSLNKLAENLSVELLAAAVRADEWTFEQAFFYAMQMQPRQRAETLVKLLEVLPERLRLQVIQAVLQAAESIRDEKYLVETLSNLVPQLSANNLPETWKVLRTIKDEKLLAQALTVLLPKLTPDWLTEALKAAIALDYYRVETLEQMAPYLKTANLLPTALKAIEEVQDGEARDKALKVLVPHLYSDLQKPALEIALKTWYFNQNVKYASKALKELAPQLPSKLLSQALESARNLSSREVYNQANPEFLKRLEVKVGGRSLDDPHPDAYVEVLEVLAPFLTSDLYKAVLKTVINSLWGKKLAQALVALVPYLPDALEPALKTIYSLQDYNPEEEAITRADYLVRLACNLPNELASHQPALLKEALEATLKICPPDIFCLLELLPYLPEASHHALESIQSLDDDVITFSFILSSLIPYVTPEQLPVVLNIINSLVVHKNIYLFLLSELVSHHPTILSLALELVLKLKNESRTESLKKLFSKLSPEHLHCILTAAHELSGERLRSDDCADILVAFAPHLTETLLPEAVEVALNIQKFEHRDRALVALVTHQPILFPSALLVAEFKRGFVISELQMERDLQNSYFLAVAVSQKIEGHTEQVEALLALIPHFPEALGLALKRLLDSGRGDAFLAHALVQLAPHLDAIPHLTTESIAQALNVARKITDNDERLQALKEIVKHLNTNLLSEALDVALAIEEEKYYAQVLIALVSRLAVDNLLSKVLKVSLLMKADSDRAALLTALAPYLPSSVTHALEATSIIGDKYHCTQVLTALSKNSCEIASQAIEMALSIDEDFYRARALTSLIPILPENLLDKVQNFASSLKQYENYDATLTELALRRPETVNYALNAILSQRGWPYHLENFTQLVPYLSENLIHKVLLAIEKVDDAPRRVEVIKVLLAYAKVTVPKVLESALEAASSQSLDDFKRAEILMKIAPYLDVTHLQKALEIVQSIGLELYQAFALRALAPQLIQSANELVQALKVAEAFKHHSAPFGRDLYYAYVMSALKPELTENLMIPIPQILGSSWFWAFMRRDCIQFLNELLPDMTVEQRLALLEAVESLNNQPEEIYSPRCLEYALPILISNLPQEHLSQALAAVKSIRYISDKIESLTTLAPRLSNDLLYEALEIVQSQFARAQDYEYVKVINVLAPYLKTPDLLNKALENISSFNYENNFYRAEALAALVSTKPEVSSKAVEIILSLDKNRAEILEKLSPYLAQVPDSYSLWKTALHSLSQSPRPDFLQDLAALVPFFSALVEQPVTDSVARSITDVARWWS